MTTRKFRCHCPVPEHRLGAGRQLHAPTLLRQIGMPTLLAVSDGRWTQIARDTVEFPAARGYAVEVSLDGADFYTVRRTSRRNGWRTVVGAVYGVSAFDVSARVLEAGVVRAHRFPRPQAA